MIEILAKVGFSLFVIAVAGGTLRWVWTHQIDPGATLDRLVKGAVQPDFVATRDPNKLYQDGHAVADVTGRVSESGASVVFEQLANTSALDQARVFEFRRRSLKVVRVDVVAGQKVSIVNNTPATLSNVLEGVECEVVN